MNSWADGILDGLEDAVCVFDSASGVILQSNSAYRRLSSSAATDGRPQHWAEWLLSHHSQQLVNLEAAIASNRKYATFLTHHALDGEATQLELIITRLEPGASCMVIVKRVPTLLPPPQIFPSDGGLASAAANADANLLRSADCLLQHSPLPSCVIRVPFCPALDRPASDGLSPGACLQASTFNPCAHRRAPLPCMFTAPPGPPEVVEPRPSLAQTLQGASSIGLDCAAFQWGAYAVLPSAYFLESTAPTEVQEAAGLEAEAEQDQGQGQAQAQAQEPATAAEGVEGPPLAEATCMFGDLVYQNAAMLQLCGHSDVALRAGGLGLLLRPPIGASEQGIDRADATEALAAFAAALAAGTGCRTQLPCYDSSGRRLLCELSVFPLGPSVGAAVSGWESGTAGDDVAAQRDWRLRAELGHSQHGRRKDGAAGTGCVAPYTPHGSGSISASSISTCGRGSVMASGQNASSGASLGRHSSSGGDSASASAGISKGRDPRGAANGHSRNPSSSSDVDHGFPGGLTSAAGAGAAVFGGAGAGEGPLTSIVLDGHEGNRKGFWDGAGDSEGGVKVGRDGITDSSMCACKAAPADRVALVRQQHEHQEQLEEQRQHQPDERFKRELHRQQHSVGLHLRLDSGPLAIKSAPQDLQFTGSELRDCAIGLCCSGPTKQRCDEQPQQQQYELQQKHQQQEQQLEQQDEQQKERKQQWQQQQKCLQMHARQPLLQYLLVVLNDVTSNWRVQHERQHSMRGRCSEQEHQHHTEQLLQLTPLEQQQQQQRRQGEQHQQPPPPLLPREAPQRPPLCSSPQRNGPAAATALTPRPLDLPAAAAAVPAAMPQLPVAAGCAACQLHDFALNSLSEGITLADPSRPDCPIVYTNQAFLTMTGYSREEVLGRNCRFLQGPGTDPAAVRTLREAVNRRQAVTVQLINYTRSGASFWNELRLTPVVSPASGKLVAYIGVQNDVSELVAHKQLEARLRDAKEAAESATQAKSQFLANMSHEIRTPLNGMIATAQLLLASALTPEQRELTETILESGSSLVGILGDILDFSRIDHGSLELQRRPMCLRQTTEACMDLVAAEASKKGLALAYLIDDAALSRPLLADPVRIRQVLANLLSNAVKFTVRGEVVVRVSVEQQDDGDGADGAAGDGGGSTAATAPLSSSASRAPKLPDCDLAPTARATACSATSAAGITSLAAAATPAGIASLAAAATPAAAAGVGGVGVLVHIAVTDTGIGIDEESAQKLFQHFRQGSETMSRRYGGTGLGLAISKRLAQLMQGDVWVNSRRGEGSTFHFTLRAEWPSVPEGHWPCSPARSASSTPTQSNDSTPRTSTDEGTHSGAVVAAAAATDSGTAAAVPVSASAPPWFLSSSSSAATTRLSNGSSGSGRELRTSPWLPDGNPRDTSDGGSALCGSASSGVLAASGGQRTSCGGASCAGSAVGVGGADAAEERAALLGRSVLVDISHAATSTQVWNSCRQLGLSALQANACASGSCCALPLLAPLSSNPPSLLTPPGLTLDSMEKPTAASTAASASAAASAAQGPDAATVVASAAAAAIAFGSPVIALSAGAAPAPARLPAQQLPEAMAATGPFDILVVSIDRLVPALKSGWKGRPVVALGDRELLPPALQPLVVLLGLPVRHNRLATALVKATTLLRWNGSSAPKLSNTPIPNESIQTLKSWRLKRGTDWESLNRRTSLDNSALERAAMARGAGAGGGGAAGGTGCGARWNGGTCGERSPARQQQQQQVPIPEHSDLPDLADDSERRPRLSGATGQRVVNDAAAASPPMAPPPATATATATATAGATVAACPGEPLGGAPLGSQPCLEQLRILIAEDNKVNQKVVLKVLQQILRGCQPPDVVENGLQVLQALRQKTYDLILMDIHMPEMDGLEASKRIQETFKPEDRPRIIALSADTVQTLHDRCREAGIEAFLVKPFRIEELARVMRTGTPRLRKQHDPEAVACGTPLTV